MYPFVETIRIEKGEICNIFYHQQRLARTMRHFYPQATVPLLSEALSRRKWPDDKIWKVHIEYDGSGILLVKTEEYHIRQIRNLRLIDDDEISYAYKSADRRCLSDLSALKGDADEIVIVRNGLLTDTSYSNIALFDGCQWITPLHPLLEGTMRQSLLDQGVVTARDIRAEEWTDFRKVSLINAMMPLGRCVCEIE
jgi:4-amino-4-deoxychorismate lyase